MKGIVKFLKRHPEIGDRPKKVPLNAPKGSIEPLERFYRTPIWPPKRFYRTPAQGLQNHKQGSTEPFASNHPFQVTLVELSLHVSCQTNAKSASTLSLTYFELPASATLKDGAYPPLTSLIDTTWHSYEGFRSSCRKTNSSQSR